MPKTLVASLVILTLLQTGASPATAQKGKPQAPTRWEVVDAIGLVIGVAVGLSSEDTAHVVVQDGEALLHLQVTKQSWDTGSSLVWTTADCTGAALHLGGCDSVQPHVAHVRLLSSRPRTR
jgi:hypothetical protein